jgi:hypothetical protein
MVLTSKEKPPLTNPLNFNNPPPNAIEVGSCTTDDVEGFISNLYGGFDDFLLRGLTSFWGPRVIVWALNDTDFLQITAEYTLISDSKMQRATGSDRDHLDDVEAEIIPDLVSMVVHGIDYTAKSTALHKLRRIGREAKQAIPVLIHILERVELNILAEDEIVDTLEKISGKNFGNNTKRWRSWWESQ